MPKPLDVILDSFRGDVEELVKYHQEGRLTLAQFEEGFAESVAEHHLAAYYAAADTRKLSAAAADMIENKVAFQLEHLNGLVDRIGADGLTPKEIANAQMYVGSAKVSYSLGVTGAVDVVQPGEDSPCMSNCGCSWRKEVVDSNTETYNLFWEMDASKENCEVCQERANQWNPLSIVFGEVT